MITLSKAEPEFGRGNRLIGHAAFERNLVAIRVPYMLSRPKAYVPSLASVPRCLSIFGVMTSYGLVTRAVTKDGRSVCAVTRTATCWSLGSSSAYAKPESDCIQSRKPSFEWLAIKNGRMGRRRPMVSNGLCVMARGLSGLFENWLRPLVV